MGIFRLSLVTFYVALLLFSTHALASKKSYVVYLGAHSHGPSVTTADYEKVTNSHYDFLASFLGSKDKAKDAIFYSYTKHINGFSAYLEEEEAAAISKHPSVVSVFLNKLNKLHTTRSWEFLGQEKNGIALKGSLMRRANFGKDVIISNLDTGVWPESKSFNDEGLGPIPSKWKGKCVRKTPNPVKCNRKLIGAKMYYEGYEATGATIDPSEKSPRDFEGHGSHTLSTAGGMIVPGASMYGHANGTAMGGSPHARVATYKVCWAGGCADSDVLAAFDDAIDDGVDVISISFGLMFPVTYTDDSVAIGSFHTVSKGIPVVCSAGNSGPYPFTVVNMAPWIITVAASTTDRTFHSDLSLWKGKRIKGRSVAQFSLPEDKFYPLIASVDAKASNATDVDAIMCHAGALDPSKVKGKIVFCHVNSAEELTNLDTSEVIRNAGGAGMIIVDDTPSTQQVYLNEELYILPGTNIRYIDSIALTSYINSTKSPKAYIFPVTTTLDNKPAPRMPDFSSVGPNGVTPEIIKPDITAPGVNILAAFSLAASPTSPSDDRRIPYAVLSGTSMSCPHVSGIVGLLKSLHPEWSAAAIRSAIMTTAATRDDANEPIKNVTLGEATPLNYGSGHVRPNSAMDPGLVYDLTLDDYLNFLCSYSPMDIALFYNKPYDCPSKNVADHNLNYPSIGVTPLYQPTTVIRRVKNVGAPGIYKVRFIAPPGVIMNVEPKTLSFKKMGEEKVFVVTLAPAGVLPPDQPFFGQIIWSDGVHHVRSPVMAIG